MSWRDPGQYGGFWWPFLVHWNVSLPEVMNFKRFDYSVRQKIGDPGSIKMQNVFPPIPVVPKPHKLQYCEKNGFWISLFGFPIFPNSLLGSAAHSPIFPNSNFPQYCPPHVAAHGCLKPQSTSLRSWHIATTRGDVTLCGARNRLAYLPPSN